MLTPRCQEGERPKEIWPPALFLTSSFTPDPGEESDRVVLAEGRESVRHPSPGFRDPRGGETVGTHRG